jgi:hypothetical protein
MNIFWLDRDPQKSAAYACDQHIVKMLTEHTQQICTVLQSLGFSDLPMKGTHPNHPCPKWVGTDFANFVYLVELNKAYFYEYKKRYGRETHAGFSKMKAVVQKLGTTSIRKAFASAGKDRLSLSVSELKSKPWLFVTVPPQAMPEELKAPLRGSTRQRIDQVISAYRDLYALHKSKFARYKYSEPPPFLAGVKLGQ